MKRKSIEASASSGAKVCGISFQNPISKNIDGSLFMWQEEDVTQGGLFVSGFMIREKAMPVKAGLKMSINLEFKILVLDNTLEHPQDFVPN
jgi:hypothetical protein